MPLAVRSSAGRRRKKPERPGESTSAPVMAPTRMKLRVRRGDGAAGGGPPPDEDVTPRESRSRNRKSNGVAPAAASSPPATSASARAVVAAEEASPDSKCPICLDRFNNLAYLDRCLHRFCFPCIQEWSHNKAECPLCKQPFASILHSVRAEDDFKEYTLRPPPANSSVAATVAMVAAMASAARSDHQMRLMLRRHRTADGGETTARRRRRERPGSRRTGVWEWYLDSPSLPHHPAVSPVVAEDGVEGDDLEQTGRADATERGVIFEGLTGLRGGAAHDDRASRRLMTRLATRQRLQREGGAVRRLRERETVVFRRALYRCGVRVRGVAGIQGQQCDITAESFRRNSAQLNRLRPWLRRELTVLYGAHGTLVDIVQRIIMAQLARRGLEDSPTIEEELRPFLLARTDHFLHELVSFARSPLSLENYDLQAVYEPPEAALELDGASSHSDSSSVIAISEGEDEEESRARRIQKGSCLSMSAWDDETPGPSYSSAEPSYSLASPPFSLCPQEAANEEEGGGKEEGEEEECLIVGYKKPIAERTPELVHLSSDTEEEDHKKKKELTDEKPPPLPSATPPLSCLPTIPPSTSGAYREAQEEQPKEMEAGRSRSWSVSSGRSRESVCSRSPSQGGRDRKQSSSDKRRRKKRRRRGRERSGTLHNPNRSIYPAMMCRPSPFHSSGESGSPPDSSWEYRCSPLTSSVSSRSSSPVCCSPPLSTPPTPSLSPSHAQHKDKPGGKRKYKSHHLDRNDKDPTWRPSGEGEEGESRRRRRRRNCGESRRCREDRSPSVEIVYEGTVVSSDATQRKRRRKRKTQHSSSPVIITLDSDSSQGDVLANLHSSSSSQQTVDFSDLPPLPSVHSAGVGGALDAEIGELPVDILDRESDGSEAGNADDCDVDVENHEERGSRDVLTNPSGPRGKGDRNFRHSDSRLLATVSERDLALNQQDSALTQPRQAPPPPQPHCDAPPLLKRASPVPPFDRNSPPPLKLMDAGGLPPVDPFSSSSPLLHLHSNLTVSRGDPRPSHHQTIPSISTLKRHFSSSRLLASGVLGPPLDSAFKCGADDSPPSQSDSSCDRKQTFSPDHFHLSGRVGAGTLTGSGVFSGVNSYHTSPPLSMASIDSRKLSSDQSPAPSDLHSFSAASGALTGSRPTPIVNHQDRSMLLGFHGNSPLPSQLTDGHLNHAASHTVFPSEPKLHRPLDSHRDPENQWDIDHSLDHTHKM